MSYNLSHYAVAHHQATLMAEASASRTISTGLHDRSLLARIAVLLRPARRAPAATSRTAAACC